MANRFWQKLGASANWSQGGTTNWATTSGGSDNAAAPTSVDDVFFDGVGTHGQDNSTLDTAHTIKSLDMTGYTGVLTHNAAVTLTVAGSGVVFKFSSGMTYTRGNATTSALSFTGTSGTTTLTTNGKTCGNITFNGAGGTWSLADTLTISNGATFTLTAGTFTANNQNLSLGFVAASGSTTRVLTMGSGTWTLTGGSGTIWTTATSTNLTLNANTSTITFSTVSVSNRVMTCNSVAVNNIVDSGLGTGAHDITLTNVSCANLDFTGSTATWNSASNAITIAGSLTLVSGMTLGFNAGITFSATAGTKTITSAGKTFGSSTTVTFNGAGGTWQLADAFSTGASVTLTNGTFDTNSFSMQSTTLSSSNSNTRAITTGSSTWTLTGNAATIIDFATSTNLTVTASSGTFSCTYSGSTGTRTINTSTSTSARLGNLKFTAGTDAVSFTNAVCEGLDFTGFAGTWSGSGATNNKGSMTVSTGLTRSYTGAITMSATSGTKTITSNGKTYASTFTFDGVGGTFQLADALTTSTTMTLTNGTLDTNGKATQCTAFDSSNSNTRAITFGATTWTLTGTGTVWNTATATNLSTTPSTSTIKINDASSTGKTFSGGNATFGNLWLTGAGTGAFTIAGSNQFNDFKVDTPPHTVNFTAGTIQRIVTWTVSGTAGNLMTLQSTSSGNPWALILANDASGGVTSDYLSLQDALALDKGGTWQAGTHSTDVSGNAGWYFGASTDDTATWTADLASSTDVSGNSGWEFTTSVVDVDTTLSSVYGFSPSISVSGAAALSLAFGGAIAESAAVAAAASSSLGASAGASGAAAVTAAPTASLGASAGMSGGTPSVGAAPSLALGVSAAITGQTAVSGAASAGLSAGMAVAGAAGVTAARSASLGSNLGITGSGPATAAVSVSLSASAGISVSAAVLAALQAELEIEALLSSGTPSVEVEAELELALYALWQVVGRALIQNGDPLPSGPLDTVIEGIYRGRTNLRGAVTGDTEIEGAVTGATRI